MPYAREGVIFAEHSDLIARHTSTCFKCGVQFIGVPSRSEAFLFEQVTEQIVRLMFLEAELGVFPNLMGCLDQCGSEFVDALNCLRFE